MTPVDLKPEITEEDFANPVEPMVRNGEKKIRIC